MISCLTYFNLGLFLFIPTINKSSRRQTDKSVWKNYLLIILIRPPPLASVTYLRASSGSMDITSLFLAEQFAAAVDAELLVLEQLSEKQSELLVLKKAQMRPT